MMLTTCLLLENVLTQDKRNALMHHLWLAPRCMV